MNFKYLLRSAALAAVLLGGSTAAQAGWIQIADPDLTDTAINPGYGAGGPANQNPATVGAWLADLINAPSVTLLGQAEEFGAATISGLASAGSLYLTLHYGNYIVGLGNRQNNVTVAFSCSTGCASFTGYVVEGLSNYRYYGTVRNVPEPLTLGLLGLGLAGVGFARRRKAA